MEDKAQQIQYHLWRYIEEADRGTLGFDPFLSQQHGLDEMEMEDDEGIGQHRYRPVVSGEA